VVAACGLAAALAAAPASAQGPTGRVEVQFQRAETPVLFPGEAAPRRLVSEFWLQTYEVTHGMRLGERTDVYGQLRLTDLSYVGEPTASRTPYGTLRMQHPWVGISGSHRPTETTIALGDTSGAPGLTTRRQETMWSGYLALPRLPRVDAAWVRRHQDAYSLIPASTGVTRSLRAAQDFGPLSLRGGYTDQLREPGGVQPNTTLQRALDGGASLRLIPSAASWLNLDYGFARTQRTATRLPEDRTITHDATLLGNLRQSPVLDWSLNYGFRHAQLATGVDRSLDNHDGALLMHYHPNRVLQAAAGGGVRSVFTATGDGILRYLTSTASLAGDVRPGLNALASAAHTTNWSPDLPTFSVEQLRSALRMALRQGIDVGTDLQVTSNGDTALRDSRVGTQAGVFGTLTPVRNLTVGFSARLYQTGSRLGQVSGRSRSNTVEARWRPARGLEVTGSRSTSGALPRNDPRFTTTQATVTLSPSSTLRVWSSYTRSDQAASTVAALLRGREAVSGRVLAALGRRWNVSAGGTIADPNQATEARQFDAAVSLSLGR
jgi:hypothetical protein